MSAHIFKGKWISDREMSQMIPRNVFHRQNYEPDPPCTEPLNRHILFRKDFRLDTKPEKAVMYISADDYYKLYINGRFAAQGPAPSYPSAYCYNTVDVTGFLTEGKNTIAVHTLYQGLINRVWVSGDYRHGLICDLEADGVNVVSSDETFRTHRHTAYTSSGTVGYDTQFLETYDSNSSEVGFESPDFDDSSWESAVFRLQTDYTMVPQPTKSLVFETILPTMLEMRDSNRLFIDFGSVYVGYLEISAKGKQGDSVTIRCGQELDDSGEVRYSLRANCVYEESWILSGGHDTLDQFDYKSFRYAELTLPEGCEITHISFSARHYPFTLTGRMNPEYAGNENLEKIWKLCVNSQKYGIQEVIQDCMEREKGFYVGDGCYTALAHLILTGDDSIVRRLIDEAFFSTFITPTIMTCLDCSLMQEIAEYPLMLISLILWHYRLCGDREYLKKNYAGVVNLLEAYRSDYEKDSLISEIDKWCVVEWPSNYRDGYDIDLPATGCTIPHVAINAYYIEAVRCANKIAAILGEAPYRDETPLTESFISAFYDGKRHIFHDTKETEHASYIGNVLAFAFMLSPNEECEKALMDFIEERGLTGVMLFGSFPLLCGMIRRGRYDKVREMLLDEGGWLRMIKEGATTTYEGWGRDSKWNTSLFHLTMSDAAVFLADIDLGKLFE